MRLTTKSKYAINALTEISALQSTGPVALSDISINQKIKLPYLEQLFRKLRIAGIVKSIRGRNGGYLYAKHPKFITIKQIMDAVEEELDATNCKNNSPCKDGKKCNTHNLWHELNNVVNNYLSETTLSSLVDADNSPYIDIREIN